MKQYTLSQFLRNCTQALELCVIRDEGYIICTVWIDYEDIFQYPTNLKDKFVKDESWGNLNIMTEHGDKLVVPCHYIDI